MTIIITHVSTCIYLGCREKEREREREKKSQSS